MAHEGTSGRDSPDPYGAGWDRPADDQRSLRAYVVTVHGREECTLAPPDASRDERLATWVTAVEDAFVALDEVR